MNRQRHQSRRRSARRGTFKYPTNTFVRNVKIAALGNMQEQVALALWIQSARSVQKALSKTKKVELSRAKIARLALPTSLRAIARKTQYADMTILWKKDSTTSCCY